MTTHTSRADATNTAAIDRAERNAREGFSDNGWARRHAAAWLGRRGGGRPVAVGVLTRAWLTYADAHLARYGSPLGDDGVLSPEWAAIGYALRGLLNGEIGALDGGTMDHIICEALAVEGFDADAEQKTRPALGLRERAGVDPLTQQQRDEDSATRDAFDARQEDR